MEASGDGDVVTVEEPISVDEALNIGFQIEPGVWKLTDYGINAAIAIIFTACIGLLMVIILGILSKVVFYYDE